ncbi:hypothetical protein KSF78_0009402 [Schistosoma japonicum]|nr:hypothetical protein KSF78_0009402 [Schistosoma japonicum]
MIPSKHLASEERISCFRNHYEYIHAVFFMLFHFKPLGKFYASVMVSAFNNLSKRKVKKQLDLFIYSDFFLIIFHFAHCFLEFFLFILTHVRYCIISNSVPPCT